ncbi:MAG: hypothetical protein AB7F75_04120 [Planctomycetota bacterium]
MSGQRLETLLLAGLFALLVWLAPEHHATQGVPRLFHLSPDEVEELVLEEDGRSHVFLRPDDGWLSGGIAEESVFWVLWELSSLRNDLVPVDQPHPQVRTLRWKMGGHWEEVGLGRLGADRLVTLHTDGKILWAPGELMDRVRDLTSGSP